MNYKFFQVDDQKKDLSLIPNHNAKCIEIPLIINPPQYFQSLENDLKTGDDKVKEHELKKFCSLTMKDNFIYYPSFSSSQIPLILIDLLTSGEESNQHYTKTILNIITNLSCKDNYCESFASLDIINILINLFLANAPNNMYKNNISDINLYLFSSICNFSTSSITYRNEAFQYILPITKYGQRIEESQIKTFVFRFILGMTYFPIDEDQLMQIINAIQNLLDYVDDSTSTILTLTLRKLSEYFNDFFNYISETPIMKYLSANLLSTQSNVIYLTLLIFTSFFKNNTFNDIPVLPSIINIIESRSIDVVKIACIALTCIVENSPMAFSIDDAHRVVQLIINIFENRKMKMKAYLINFLLFLFNKYDELIDETRLESFIVTLADCLKTDDEDFLVQTLNIIDIIVTRENNGDPNNKPLFDYLWDDEYHEIIETLQNDENSNVSQLAIQLSKSLNFTFNL